MSHVLTESPSLGLDRYLAIIRRQRWIMAMVTGLGLLAALGYLLVQPQQFIATTLVKVSVISSEPFTQQRSESGLLDAQTEQQMARSSAVLSSAAKSLDTGRSTVDLRQAMTATLLPDATVLRITYAASTSEAAKTGADTIAQAYLDFRTSEADVRRETIVDQLNARRDVLRQEVIDANGAIAKAAPGSPERAQALADRQVLSTELDSLASDLNVLSGLDTTGGSVLTAAADNPTDVTPRRWLVAATGLAAGLALGLVAAFVANVVDRRVHDDYDVAGAQAGSVFAVVSGGAGTIPAEGEDLDAIESARERLLATFDPRGGVLAVLDLTRGPEPSDLPVNLAAVLAQAQTGVDLVLPGWPRETVDSVIGALGGSRKRQQADRIPLLGGRLALVVRPGSKNSDRSGMKLLQAAQESRDPQRALVIAVPSTAPSAVRLASGRMSDSTVLVAERLGTRIGELARLATELRAVDTVVRGTILVAHHRRTEFGQVEPVPVPPTATSAR